MASSPRSRAMARAARRAWPLILAAYERWRELSPEEKELYKARARRAGERGLRMIERRRRRGGPGHRSGP
ncbi:MAG: hypothetical protein M3088_01220 [Actinomycetota bacterium]|nr:hypothetical protein [Actinomycetota bacterium]